MRFYPFPLDAGEMGVRDTHTQPEWKREQKLTCMGERGGVGDPNGGQLCRDSPLSQSDSGSPWAASYTGSALTGPSTGTLGLFLRKKDRKQALCIAAPSRSLRGPPCCVCFKVPATCRLWSGAAPVSEPPGPGAQARAQWDPCGR